jgi:metal-responsive CopG/Arc/MetJ family transcriptional regulator
MYPLRLKDRVDAFSENNSYSNRSVSVERSWRGVNHRHTEMNNRALRRQRLAVKKKEEEKVVMKTQENNTGREKRLVLEAEARYACPLSVRLQERAK